MKLQPIEQNDKTIGYYYKCPGCKIGHALYTCDRLDSPTGSKWEFNGDMERPTFKPSVLSDYSKYGIKASRCHSYVTDGKIIYLPDCSHDLAGQTIEMIEIK